MNQQGQEGKQVTVSVEEIDFKMSGQGAQLVLKSLTENHPMAQVEGLVADLRKQFDEQVQALAIKQGLIPTSKPEPTEGAETGKIVELPAGPQGPAAQ